MLQGYTVSKFKLSSLVIIKKWHQCKNASWVHMHTKLSEEVLVAQDLKIFLSKPEQAGLFSSICLEVDTLQGSVEFTSCGKETHYCYKYLQICIGIEKIKIQTKHVTIKMIFFNVIRLKKKILLPYSWSVITNANFCFKFKCNFPQFHFAILKLFGSFWPIFEPPTILVVVGLLHR